MLYMIVLVEKSCAPADGVRPFPSSGFGDALIRDGRLDPPKTEISKPDSG